MTRLVLVRHGESIVTVNRVIGGHRTCTGLSPLGRTQAERLRDRWSASPDFTADVLIASHYARAQETAHILSPALGGLEPFIDAGFGEHDPGRSVWKLVRYNDHAHLAGLPSNTDPA